MTQFSNILYQKAPPEIIRSFIDGTGVEVLTTTFSIIREGRKVGLSGSIKEGAPIDEKFNLPLVDSILKALNGIVELWFMANIPLIETALKYTISNEITLVSIKSNFHLTDNGSPYLKTNLKALSPIGESFLKSNVSDQVRDTQTAIITGAINRLAKVKGALL